MTSSEEAQQVYNAVEDERRQRRAAMRAAAHDLAQAVQGLERAQQQLSLADQRAGRARFIIVKSGFPSFARPQIQLRPAPILQTAGLSLSCIILLI